MNDPEASSVAPIDRRLAEQPPVAPPLLSIEGLTVRFGGLTALADVDLTVRRGRTTAIIGPNGAGKTTLFNAVAGAVKPTAGAIRLAGRDVTPLSPSARCHAGIGRTFQITQPFGGLTVRENVMVPITMRGGSVRQARHEAEEYVAFVGLMAKIDEQTKTLSTGQRKRLELARALATHPRLLLLDEVTGGVDRPSIPSILEVIRRLREERDITIVVVEHNMEVLLQLADDATFLNRGEVLVSGDIMSVARNETVRHIYLGDGHA